MAFNLERHFVPLRKMEKVIIAEIGRRYGHRNMVSYYSAYPESKNGRIMNNLHHVITQKRVVFVNEFDDFWSRDGKGVSFVSKPIKSPTWLDAAVEADEAIRTTHDYHHRFFEGVRDTGQYDKGTGARIYKLVYGS